MSFIKSLTPEQRAENLAKAIAARREKAAEREANKLLIKTEYLDSGYWSCLTIKHKIRMPSNLDAVSVKTIRKYLKRCNTSVEIFNDHYTSMSYFVKNNPLWSDYAAVGLILELKDTYKL